MLSLLLTVADTVAAAVVAATVVVTAGAALTFLLGCSFVLSIGALRRKVVLYTAMPPTATGFLLYSSSNAPEP